MEWIDFKTQPPPDATDVLCYRSDGLPPIVAGNFYGLMHTEETGCEVRGTVTHWMPLPKVPNA